MIKSMEKDLIKQFQKKTECLERSVRSVETEYEELLSDIFNANGFEIAGYVADNVNIGSVCIYIESIWIDGCGEWMIHGGTKDFEADIRFASLSVVAMYNVINAILTNIEKESKDENTDRSIGSQD